MSLASFGRYEIRRELGRGAMGVVYEAFDPERGLEVALKIMSPPPNPTPDAVERQTRRFCQEARVLSELSHPLIVRGFDQGEIGGRPYFTMELVRGTNLRDRLQFQGALSLPELLRLAVDMCDALDHLRVRGVVHQDVKPDNIMLLPDGRSKLMDFGIARMVLEAPVVPASGFQGSPAYMSPEQVAGGPVDCRADVYSLGVTLYEAASGRRAFTGDSIPAITHRVMHEYPPPLTGLPLYLQAVLMKAMSKDPLRRYATAREMAMDIRAERIPMLDGGDPANRTIPPAPLYSRAPAAAASAPPARGDRIVLDDRTISVTPPGAPQACRSHPRMRGVAYCTSCRQPVCYACLLELPRRGVVCRACAFGER